MEEKKEVRENKELSAAFYACRRYHCEDVQARIYHILTGKQVDRTPRCLPLLSRSRAYTIDNGEIPELQLTWQDHGTIKHFFSIPESEPTWSDAQSYPAEKLLRD